MSSSAGTVDWDRPTLFLRRQKRRDEEIRERAYGRNDEHAGVGEDPPLLALLRIRESIGPGLHSRSTFLLQRRTGRKII